MLALQRGLPGFPGRRLLSTRTFRSEKVLQRGLPGFPGRRVPVAPQPLIGSVASTGSPWFPREKGRYSRASRSRATGFNGVSLVSQGEGACYPARWRTWSRLQRGLPGFPGRRLYRVFFPAPVRSRLQRGLPGFPGRRQPQADACQAPRGREAASTGSPWFPREKVGAVVVGDHAQGAASTGSPWFPREKVAELAHVLAAVRASTGSPWFPREKARK